MSITQTFYLAHKARGKLSSEAARSDHNLRLLVGHANLLDSLMLHLQNAEKEQDAWFNAMVRGNSVDEDDSEVMETISEVEEEQFGVPQGYESESSESESEDDYKLDSEYFTNGPQLSPYKEREPIIDVDEVEIEHDDFEEEEDGFYSLRRTHSHAPSPPELIEDDDSDSENSNPPSPPQPSLPAPMFYDHEKGRKHLGSNSLFESSPDEFVEQSYYQPTSMINPF